MHLLLYVRVLQAEDIRTSIDKIDESVVEIKKLYSTILSAPTSDQSRYLKYHSKTNHEINFLFTTLIISMLLNM